MRRKIKASSKAQASERRAQSPVKQEGKTSGARQLGVSRRCWAQTAARDTRNARRLDDGHDALHDGRVLFEEDGDARLRRGAEAGQQRE